MLDGLPVIGIFQLSELLTSLNSSVRIALLAFFSFWRLTKGTAAKGLKSHFHFAFLEASFKFGSRVLHLNRVSTTESKEREGVIEWNYLNVGYVFDVSYGIERVCRTG